MLGLARRDLKAGGRVASRWRRFLSDTRLDQLALLIQLRAARSRRRRAPFGARRVLVRALARRLDHVQFVVGINAAARHLALAALGVALSFLFAQLLVRQRHGRRHAGRGVRRVSSVRQSLFGSHAVEERIAEPALRSRRAALLRGGRVDNERVTAILVVIVVIIRVVARARPQQLRVGANVTVKQRRVLGSFLARLDVFGFLAALHVAGVGVVTDRRASRQVRLVRLFELLLDQRAVRVVVVVVVVTARVVAVVVFVVRVVIAAATDERDVLVVHGGEVALAAQRLESENALVRRKIDGARLHPQGLALAKLGGEPARFLHFAAFFARGARAELLDLAQDGLLLLFLGHAGRRDGRRRVVVRARVFGRVVAIRGGCELLVVRHHLEPPAQERLEVGSAEHPKVGAAGLHLRRGGAVGEEQLALGREHELGVVGQRLHRVLGRDEGAHRRLRREQHVRVRVVPAALPLLLAELGVQHVERRRGLLRVLTEDVLRVEQARVDRVGRAVVLAHHEDLGRLAARRRRLRRVDLLEELLEDPHERVVVLRAVDLGDERAALAEVVGRAAQRRERDLVLHVRVLHEGRADVRRAVAQHEVGLDAVQLAPQHRAALGARDVRDQRAHVPDRSDREQVHGEDGRVERQRLRDDLRPAAGRGAQVDHDARAVEDAVLLVDLRELERRARPEALLLREQVVAVVLGALRDAQKTNGIHIIKAKKFPRGFLTDPPSDVGPWAGAVGSCIAKLARGARTPTIAKVSRTVSRIV